MSRISLTEHQIAEHSYLIWEREGRPEGRHLEHWFRAKAEMEAAFRTPKGPIAEQKPEKAKKTTGKTKRTSERRKK